MGLSPSSPKTCDVEIRFEEDGEVRGRLLVRLADLLEETLEDVPGAVASHRQRLDLDPTDLDAMSALERLYERLEQWQELIEVLRARENVVVEESEQRAIARRIGAIYEEQLHDRDNAIVAYDDVLTRFGQDRETLAALARLYEAEERWQDLLDVVQLDHDIVDNVSERAELRFRAAELMRTRTREVERAIEAYFEVLEQVPDHPGALASLEAIVGGEDPDARVAAARVLVPRYEASASYHELIGALEVMAATDDPFERLRALRRAAEVADIGLENPTRAFEIEGRAVRAALGEPDLGSMLKDLERFAAAAERWEEYVTLLRSIAPDILDGDLSAQVLLDVANIARTRLEDPELARQYYQQILEARPDHEGALDALEELHYSAGDDRALLEVLRRKTELAGEPGRRVDLLLRQAELCETKLDDVPGAVDAYEQVLMEQERSEAYDGLDRLYRKAERYTDLVSLYERQLDNRVGDPVEVRYRLGRVFLEHLTDPLGALEQFRAVLAERNDHEPTIAALESMMDDPEQRGQAAEILEPVFLSRMDWPKVTAALEARLSAEADFDERKALLRRLGQIYEDYLQDLEGALETYARLFREDPTEGEVWDILGRLARILDKWDRLAEIYAAALADISIDGPETAKLAFQTAAIYDQRTGESAKAAPLYARALRFDPLDRRSFEALESVYLRTEQWEPLLDLYREQVDVAANDEDRITLLRKSALIREERLGDASAAVDMWREALEIDPREAGALDALDRLLTAQERWVDLSDHLRHRIDVAMGTPDEVELSHRLGVVLADKLHDTSGAIDVFEDIAQRHPGHQATVQALEVLVQDLEHRLRITRILEPIYEASDQWKKRIAIYEAQVELSDDSMERVRLLGEVARLHEERGNSGAMAFQAWARAFVEDPQDETVRNELDRLAAQLGAWDEHVAAYEQAIAGTDDPMVKSQLLGTMARVHDEKRGDPRSAIDTYERLAEHEPDDPSPLDALEALHTMVGDWRGMVDVVQRKVERSFDPAERGELLRRAGSVLEELLTDPQGAIDVYRRAVAEDETDDIALEALDRLYVAQSRHEELAEVLRRRTELAVDPELRVTLGLRLGALAETQLGRPEEAVEAYQRVLDDAPGHAQAVEALARLYERQAMWPELLDNLRMQAGIEEEPARRVGLLYKAGEVLERELDDMLEAMALYQQALDIEPRHEPSLSALMRIAQLEDYRAQAAEILEPLLQVQERWDDLSQLLERKADAATDPVDKRLELRRLAEVQEHGRHDLSAAFDALRRALAEDAADASTADELERVASQLGGFDRLADAFAARASSVLDPTVARGLYTRVARIAEEALEDDARAIEAYARALEQVGDDEELLASIDRLYVKTQSWSDLGDVIERRANLAMDPLARNELLLRLAELREQHYGDRRAAFSALSEILEGEPNEPRAIAAMEGLVEDPDLAFDVVETLDRVYRQIGATDKVAALYNARIGLADTDGERVRLLSEAAQLWEQDLGDPVRALSSLRRAFELDPRDQVLLDDVERLAAVANEWESLRGMVERVSDSDDIDRMIRRDLNMRAASWYRDRLGDLPAAESRLRAALEAEPDSPEAYAQLASILRAPDREMDLVRTLRAWAAIELDDLARKDRLREAARLAESALADIDTAAACHEAILEADPSDPQSLAELSRIRAEQQRFDDVVALLARRIDVESDPVQRLALRRQLAGLYGGVLNAPERAMDAWRGVLDEEPTDLDAIEALQHLYEHAERWDDLRELLDRRLDIATTDDERIAARVRLARLVEQAFGRRAEAIDQLHEILEMDPGNREALDELERLLGADGKWDQVVELLERRAGDAAGDLAEELGTLERLAGVHEEQREDAASAAAVYRRMLERDPGNLGALRALVRLGEKLGDYSAVADAEQRLLDVLGGAEAIEVAHQLASVADEQLGDPARAEAALRRAFDLDPASETTRSLLKSHYERHEQWAQLAQMLIFEEQETQDQTAKVVLLKKAAELYDAQLGDPASAATYLEQASVLVPEDREVLLPLCDLYIAAGRQGDAIPVLEKIIDSYGKRRVKELAQFHHRLGKALEGMGNKAGALEHYDAAFKIDLTNVAILRDLGKLCHTHGDLDRAQKTFRALLLQKLDGGAGISKADVYFYLGDISAKQGDKNKAISMLERAVSEQSDHTDATQLLATLKV